MYEEVGEPVAAITGVHLFVIACTAILDLQGMRIDVDRDTTLGRTAPGIFLVAVKLRQDAAAGTRKREERLAQFRIHTRRELLQGLVEPRQETLCGRRRQRTRPVDELVGKYAGDAGDDYHVQHIGRARV